MSKLKLCRTVTVFNIQHFLKETRVKNSLPFGRSQYTIKLFLEKLPAFMQPTLFIFAFPAYFVLLVVRGGGRQSVEIRKYSIENKNRKYQR